MRRSVGWAAILFSIATGSAVAGGHFPPLGMKVPDKAAEKADAVVEQFILDLGSEDYRTREKAGRELALRGEKVLPAMRRALAVTESPEVHRRLLVMVRKLDYDRLVAPKAVTLNMKDKTVKQAMEEIAKQTGYKIECNGVGGRGGAEQKFTFEYENVPFWQAVDQVAAKGGCVVFNDYGEDDTLHVYNQDATNPFVAYSGPFRFMATNINSNKNVQLSGIGRRGGFNQNRQEWMNLNFQIQSEPKNPMLGVSTIELLSVIDDLGGSMLPPQNQNNRSNYYGNGFFRSHNTFGNINLSRNDKSATTIKSLKAKVGITLLSGTVPEIVVPDPLKLAKKTFTGRTVEIEFTSLAEDANNKGHYTLEVTAKRLGVVDAERGEDFNWSNSMWQRVELLDAAGNHYQCSNGNNQDNNGSTIKLSLPFGPENRRGQSTAKLGPPAKLLVNEWLSVVHDVTVEFKDVPLP